MAPNNTPKWRKKVAREYMETHPGVSYTEALRLTGPGDGTPARPHLLIRFDSAAIGVDDLDGFESMCDTVYDICDGVVQAARSVDGHGGTAGLFGGGDWYLGPRVYDDGVATLDRAMHAVEFMEGGVRAGEQVIAAAPGALTDIWDASRFGRDAYLRELTEVVTRGAAVGVHLVLAVEDGFPGGAEERVAMLPADLADRFEQVVLDTLDDRAVVAALARMIGLEDVPRLDPHRPAPLGKPLRTLGPSGWGV